MDSNVMISVTKLGAAAKLCVRPPKPKIQKLLRFCNRCCKSYCGFSSVIGTLLEIMSPPIIVYIPMLKISDLEFFHVLCVAKVKRSCTYCCKKDLFYATFATHICIGGCHGSVIVPDVPRYVCKREQAL